MKNALRDLLSDQNSNLGKILVRANQLQLLNKQLNEYLDAELRGLCCVANIRNNILIIQANNAVVATQLRFQCSDLLHHFRSQLNMPNVSTIQIIVRHEV